MIAAPLASAARSLVLDTNVCLDLLLFADPAVTVLAEQLRRGVVRAYYDKHTRLEWQRVLGYAVWKLDGERQRRLSAEFDQLFTAYGNNTPATPVPLPACRDPDDQKFLQLAAALPAAAVLLTKDRDLLKLARSCRRKVGFAIFTPGAWCALAPAESEALWLELGQRRAVLRNPGF